MMPRAGTANVTAMLVLLAGLGGVLGALGALAQQQPPAREAPSRPAPQPADDVDSAQTIEDDPRVAPDEASSADNNLTFPVDI